MSELRQRRGEVAKKPVGGKKQDQRTSEDAAALAESLKAAIAQANPPPEPGLTNKAKVWKDKLYDDPYNMEYIYELGCAYHNDRQWLQCCNVLLRGWKRMSEVKEADVRFDFLMKLCHASFTLNKKKQAYAVLVDIEEPQDRDDCRQYSIMACQVSAENADLTRALKAFHKAIENCKFEEAATVWVATCLGLKKVGAYDAAKQAIESLIGDNEAHREKFETLSSILDLREQITNRPDADKVPLKTKLLLALVLFILFVLFSIVIWYLWKLETQSIANLKKPSELASKAGKFSMKSSRAA
eukprot:gnl/TRDRNA2_/TRDRNA2_166473_c4_seq1.p1 gnl/TRDRNA2_/TRDRNA2_166473_c4~~gnl/TRDRNA2_/TRDRNA2_166473_c4_seq1.p1  ORF type:complete len:299 (+),score=72.78 gnl/TRDRNA2_/TRDRNA2_166473_c4_seq1:101-997(+)